MKSSGGNLMFDNSIATTRRLIIMACDFAVLAMAFWLAVTIVPTLVSMTASIGILHAGWITTFLAQGGESGNPSLSLVEFSWVFVAMCPVTIVCYELFGGHRPARELTVRSIAFASALAPTAGVGVLTLVLFTLKHGGYSRLLVFSFALLSALLLGVGRYAAVMTYRERLKNGYLAKEVALIGASDVLQQFATLFQCKAHGEYNLVGYFPLSPHQPPPCLSDGRELPSLGPVEQVADALIHTPIHDVVIGVPPDGAPWLGSVLIACDYFRVTTYVIPEILLKTKFRDIKPVSADSLFECPLVKLDPGYIDSQLFFMKRMLDICISGILLVVVSPLMLLIAIAIKLTTPQLPVFYPWRVVGFKGRRFTGYKFTTMVADADAKKLDLMARNEMTGPVFKIADDPRVTPLGRFLRKYSLNELPQLWSVLKGDMSLVGPRPAGPHELKRYDMWHKRKLSVMPGITCFWQVRGRNRITNFDDWVRMDLEYIENWSLWLDCKLIARTAWVVLAGSGS
jgi:exopolysaccharide biosynthesis polyprenyl glycosylphosphotransferase